MGWYSDNKGGNMIDRGMGDECSWCFGEGSWQGEHLGIEEWQEGGDV